MKDNFGLKGRFYQPRPKAWDCGKNRNLTLKGSFTFLPCNLANGPFRAEALAMAFPRPSAWADRIGLSGRKALDKILHGIALRG